MSMLHDSTALQVVLWTKIVVTLLFWSLPLLLLPISQFNRFGIPQQPPVLFIRLLGAAYAALLVGYMQGVHALRLHHDITPTVWVGVVSNGLACAILSYHGYAGTWTSWGRFARRYMWLSALLTGALTVGLIWSGLLAGGARIP